MYLPNNRVQCSIIDLDFFWKKLVLFEGYYLLYEITRHDEFGDTIQLSLQTVKDKEPVDYTTEFKEKPHHTSLERAHLLTSALRDIRDQANTL